MPSPLSGLTLTFTRSRRHPSAANTLGAKLTCVATPTTGGQDAAVFVFQRTTVNYLENTFGAKFSNICSPAEYWDLPIGDPDSPPDGEEFFRADTVELVFTGFDLMDETQALIKGDCETLITALGIAEDGDTEVVVETI